MVSNDDYDVWKSDFGMTAEWGALTAAAVPESDWMSLFVVVLAIDALPLLPA